MPKWAPTVFEDENRPGSSTAIGQPHNGANARRRHQEPRAGIALRQLAHLFVKTVQFLKQDRMHSKKSTQPPR